MPEVRFRTSRARRGVGLRELRRTRNVRDGAGAPAAGGRGDARRRRRALPGRASPRSCVARRRRGAGAAARARSFCSRPSPTASPSASRAAARPSTTRVGRGPARGDARRASCRQRRCRPRSSSRCARASSPTPTSTPAAGGPGRRGRACGRALVALVGVEPDRSSARPSVVACLRRALSSRSRLRGGDAGAGPRGHRRVRPRSAARSTLTKAHFLRVLGLVLTAQLLDRVSNFALAAAVQPRACTRARHRGGS